MAPMGYCGNSVSFDHSPDRNVCTEMLLDCAADESLPKCGITGMVA